MRTLLLLAALALTAAAPLAQSAPDAGSPEATSPEAHALPFASERNHIVLAVGGASGAVRVSAVEPPAWVRFEQAEVDATASEGGEPLARLVFAIAPEAPVGEAVDLVLEVRDATGAAVGLKTIRVVVSPPEAVALEAPRPNPSRGGARAPFVLPAESAVRLSVLDMLGREVAVLVDGARAAGRHEARVPRLASGVYVVRLLVDGGREVAMRRLTVAR